ncbi:MAG: hypothetical protein ACI4QI_06025 [Candidatus Coproplasma sp.]
MNESIAINENNSFFDKHSKGIMWGMITVGGIVTGFLVYKNREIIDNLFGTLFKLPKQGVPSMPKCVETSKQLEQVQIVEKTMRQHIEVPMYCRKLPIGQKASAGKIAMAAEMGYELADNMTLVRKYSYERVI